MCPLLEIKHMGFVFFKVIKSFLMQAPHPHTLLPGLKGIPPVTTSPSRIITAGERTTAKREQHQTCLQVEAVGGYSFPSVSQLCSTDS